MPISLTLCLVRVLWPLPYFPRTKIERRKGTEGKGREEEGKIVRLHNTQKQKYANSYKFT